MNVPLLVLVSGAPGSGKTTLARQLASKLGLPLIAKDDIKESLGDSLEKTSLLWSRRLGKAAWDVMFVLLERFMFAGASAIFESNFYPDLHRDRLLRLRRDNPFIPFEIHCTADAATLVRRHRTRERHRIHHTNRPSVRTMESWIAQNGPLRLTEHFVRVDTGAPDAVDLDGIVTDIRGIADGI